MEKDCIIINGIAVRKYCAMEIGDELKVSRTVKINTTTKSVLGDNKQHTSPIDRLGDLQEQINAVGRCAAVLS